MNWEIASRILRTVRIGILVALCGGSSLVWGQAAGASLSGQVTDSSGAAVPEAQVMVRNVETNLVQNVATNGQGEYQITPLPPGRYALTVQRQGFETYVQNGLILTVNQSATQNVQMKPGAVQQTVSVTANAEVLNTNSAEISSLVDQNAVVQLPLNGRDPSTLVSLLPERPTSRTRPAPTPPVRSSRQKPAPPSTAAARAASTTCSTVFPTSTTTTCSLPRFPMRMPPRNFGLSPIILTRDTASPPAP